MTKVLSVAAVLAAAAGAQAAFSGVAVDFAAGTPLVASAPYAQSGTATNDLGVVGFGPAGQELSSGLWMSGTGINTAMVAPGFFQTTGRPAELAAPSNSTAIVGGTLAGSWLITPAFEQDGENAAAGGLVESVLVARLSVPVGATIDFGSASALVTIVLDGDVGPTQILATFGGNNGGFGFEAVLFQSGGLLDGSAVDTYDVYFGTVVPTPGAVALAGIAGLAGVRRRR